MPGSYRDSDISGRFLFTTGGGGDIEQEQGNWVDLKTTGKRRTLPILNSNKNSRNSIVPETK